MATERLVIDLVQTGLIKLGLRDKKFVRKFKQMQRGENKEQDEEEIKNSNQKKVHKLNKRVIELLKADQFQEALEALGMVMKIKKLDWHDVSGRVKQILRFNLLFIGLIRVSCV